MPRRARPMRTREPRAAPPPRARLMVLLMHARCPRKPPQAPASPPVRGCLGSRRKAPCMRARTARLYLLIRVPRVQHPYIGQHGLDHRRVGLHHVGLHPRCGGCPFPLRRRRQSRDVVDPAVLSCDRDHDRFIDVLVRVEERAGQGWSPRGGRQGVVTMGPSLTHMACASCSTKAASLTSCFLSVRGVSS